MPLDEFKTQILLLHSEQSTLDNLSSGFGDSYTVHCATSGSEALNFLVETPINVIISAHDLPGMSGLDALREAKKRSPATIGILLAGTATTDIEALVGEEEVFQVVSGQVTSAGLLQLVDKATRQMRLLALADSANDTTADMDHPAEHIIMETSENGSTIISDGTGRMPVLDPKKVAASVNVGSRSVDILVLTKDQEFLETIKDSSRGMHKVYYANTLGQANEAIGKYKIGVAVVDAAMVGEKIEQLTQHLRKNSARLVAIVAGRRDDGEMLMDLINRGKVYRFLLKPVSPGRARLAVEASVKHHLEAPDAAFRINGISPTATPAVAAKPAPRPAPVVASKPAHQATPVAPKPVPQAAPEPVATAKPAPIPQSSQVAAPARPDSDPPLGPMFDADGLSPIEDGLSDAFGDDDSSFTETVTGLISSVSRKFSSPKDVSTPPEAQVSDSSPATASAGSGGSLLQNPKLMGIAATALVIVVSALYWFMIDSNEADFQQVDPLRTQSFTETDIDFNTVPPTTAEVDVEALLEEARLARGVGQLFNPVGSNAIELFAAAMAADPGNSLIAAELDATIGQALSMAESALLDSRLDETDAALKRVAAADPQNIRLPFLTAQLTQMQLRGRLDEARVAMREDRFEDAGAALNAASNLGITDSTEIDVVLAELDAARSAQQAGDILTKAAERLDAGALLSPPNNNARYFYELVLSNDAENIAAHQGLGVIAAKLAFQARTAIDNGNLAGAEDLLSDARSVDPTNSEVASTITALASANAAIAEQLRRAVAERRAAERRQATAERQAEAEAEADRQAAAALLAATQAISGTEVAAAGQTQEMAAQENADVDAVSSLAADSDGEIADAAPAESIVQAPAKATTPAPNLGAPASVSSLIRTKYVAPKYPRSAQRRNISGWVDVVFTVAIDGTVSNVEVRSSEPDETFVNAAVSAIEKWEFEAVVENGIVVEKLAGVRMMFALEN